MARYAVVEGVYVTNVIEYDPEIRRLPAEVEETLRLITTDDPIEAGWTWSGNLPLPPLGAPPPREVPVSEAVDMLDGQVAALQLQAGATEIEADALREEITELDARVRVLERG